MLMRLSRPIREVFNVEVSRRRVEPVQVETLTEIFRNTLSHHKGIAIGEQWHGDYSFPLFMRDMMPAFKEMNVTRFYTEMALAEEQAIINDWQEGRDEDSFPDHLDSAPNYFAYSKHMWQHYWLMMCAAREAGIKIVGIDNPKIRTGYGAVMDAPFKTMFWESTIEKDRKTAGARERYIVYGGESHITDNGGNLKGIHQLLNIPRVFLQKGDGHGAGNLILEKESYIMRLPKVSYQDPPSAGVRDVRSVPVRYPLPERKP